MRPAPALFRLGLRQNSAGALERDEAIARVSGLLPLPPAPLRWWARGLRRDRSRAGLEGHIDSAPIASRRCPVEHDGEWCFDWEAGAFAARRRRDRDNDRRHALFCLPFAASKARDPPPNWGTESCRPVTRRWYCLPWRADVHGLEQRWGPPARRAPPRECRMPSSTRETRLMKNSSLPSRRHRGKTPPFTET